uniref:Uncharacterized protein n=1 Tax=Rhizophagus irregularis (strain DAOM 181602 / DAOM 197198 / MUCL 43194) TaxID=747089 RepID=U9TKA9_RHIID
MLTLFIRLIYPGHRKTIRKFPKTNVKTFRFLHGTIIESYPRTIHQDPQTHVNTIFGFITQSIINNLIHRLIPTTTNTSTFWTKPKNSPFKKNQTNLTSNDPTSAQRTMTSDIKEIII